MLEYHEYQKEVYALFLDKRNQDNRFNFSVRQKASKGAETNYFIGTEKGQYFSTTLWYIKAGYPGSAGDLINVIFSYTKNEKLCYYIEFNQTRTPDDEQNRFALDLIKALEILVKESLGLKKKSNKTQKILNYKTAGRKENYTDLQELIQDVFKDLEILMPFVNRNIDRIKSMHPEFVAHQISNEEFENQQIKLKDRLQKYSSVQVDTEEATDKFHKDEDYKDQKVFSLNQILYGPPGTGKTYHTINKAIEIVNPKFDLNQDRSRIKIEYDRLVKNGQIVFTTFHQSMSYEDFIEGIKPIEPEKEGDPINYKVEYGVFRRLCVHAAFELIQSKESKETEQVLDFSIIYDNYAEKVQELIFNNETVELESKSGGKLIVESISAQGNFIVKHPDGTRTYTISKPRLSKLNSAIKNLIEVNNINDHFREIIGGSNSSAYWAVLNAIRKQSKKDSKNKSTRHFTFEEKLEVVNGDQNYKNLNGKPYVLIIDEINRGNVSQIFGELITLIEEDKRLGKEEELEVVLPYSKKSFGVPANLYIIGTMNTADRSVEALDAALRRRFTFEEMAPKPNLLSPAMMLQRLWIRDKEIPWTNPDWIKTEKLFLDLFTAEILNRNDYEIIENEVNTESFDIKFEGIVNFEGINFEVILNVINQRIEKLLDKDHQIGHSYLINVYSIDQLKSAFQNKIIPLLQEYFFGDYGKIGLILGEEFFEKIEENDAVIFKKFNDYEADDFSDRKIYRLKNLSDMKDDAFKAAIIEIVN